VALERRTVEVVADWQGLPAPTLLGVLSATPVRGKQVFAFTFDERWLAQRATSSISLDPGLRQLRGVQYVAAQHDNFGLFLDSSPDRWGRVLMMRREAASARAAKRSVRHLTELDFLLGVFDGHRMGGLRFRYPGGDFLDDNPLLASPPWTTLRQLEHASLRLQQPDAQRDADYLTWLNLLLAPGRSLGGARPKASVIDPKGHLWIAKFPSLDDVVDVGAWEYVVHQLAKASGILVAEARIERFASNHATFLSKRFDRTTAGSRIHFASAMTLLQRRDGELGASYLDLAEMIIQHGARPANDLEQLWRRVVFSMCVCNVDDHLRNHGFLLGDQGWLLSPGYDINPVATGNGLTLNVSATDNAQDLSLATEVAGQFRVKPARSKQIISEIQRAVKTWRAVAKKVHLSRAAQDQMASAFRLAAD
jgi:serine/threonine-protein kinase HipA